MARFDHRWIWTLLAGSSLAMSVTLPGHAGDEEIFSAQVAPNVVLMVDNSGSMNSIMFHPSFDAENFVPTCTTPLPAGGASGTFGDQLGRGTSRVCGGSTCRFEIRTTDTGWVATADTTDHPSNGYITRRYCGRDRKLYTDGVNWAAPYNNRTWYERDYTNWLFSLDTTSSTPVGPVGAQMTPTVILADMDVNNNGQNYITGATFPKYKIARITAARQIARDVIYQTNSDCPAYLGDCGVYEDRVRFGLAKFTTGANGGYVAARVDSYSNNRTALNTSISSLDAETSTPLGETLFKLYTFFMSRTTSNRPFGVNGATRFPNYTYRMSDGLNTGTTALVAPDPVTQVCQKHFVIMITDGEPTNDHFTTSGLETNGFASYNVLVGDYAPDAVGDDDIGTDATPEVGNPPWPDATSAGWMDDIAKFMQDRDCRLDLAGKQNIDVYTVGFTTRGPANTLLNKTAISGNGLFFKGSQAEALTDALVDSLQDIISKSQGFSAATVPAARTADGGQLYTTLFQPTSTRPFWPGLLRSYKITAAGWILDRNGACALENLADPTVCTGGTFKSESAAPPYWNASKEMPGANARKLKVSLAGSTGQVIRTFDHTLEQVDLGGALGTISLYPPAAAVTAATDLDEAVVSFVAGCRWGTGLSSGGGDDFQGCVDRTQIVDGLTQPDRLGDIFHSNPIVVGSPTAYIPEASYTQFSNLSGLIHRDRVIMAGANDGFLHGFLAGEWQTTPAPAKYDVGTGVEVFGFMPWGARSKVMNMAKKDASGHPKTVDGSPAVADVWIDSDTNNTNAKVAAEWKTVLVTGLREGGEHYLALDITDPADSNYPSYMWEFPTELDSSWRARIAQTWSQPVITRVRLENGSGELVEKWVAVIGFGYDPTSDPNNTALYNAASLKGRGVMMLDIETGAPIAVRKFGTGTGDVSDMLYAMPSSPGVLDYNQDGFADLIYIGDLGGNVWKWVIRSPGTADPTSSQLYQANWSFRKFFSDDPTRTAGAHARSFFFAPSATIVNSILYIGLGTGERADLNCSSTLRGCNLLNRFFILKDRDVWDRGTLAVTDGRSYPTGQITDVTAFEDSCPGVQPRGFSFSVADGEKFVTNSEVFNAFFFASTFKPDLANVCEPSGTSVLYGFLAKCGQGFFGPPSSLSPIAGIDRSMDLGKGMPTDARLSIAPGDGGNRLIISKQDGQLINLDSGSADSEHGTLYWREID